MARTEQDILKDFEKLGYEVIQNNNIKIVLQNDDIEIYIYKSFKEYGKEDIFSNEANRFDMQEHKLLHELFTCWGWI